jgi:hypothetical protein
MPFAVRRTLWLAIGALFALAAYVAATTSSGAGPAHAADGTLVHVKQASLDQGCGDQSITGAHFVINQITAPPASIDVVLSDGSTVVVPLSKQLQKVAHYTVTFAGGLTVTDATAMVPAGWTGQFVLSNYICGPGGSSTPPSTSTAPSTGSSSTGN